jgi:patatin-like phospholipase/acyl hydrolase
LSQLFQTHLNAKSSGRNLRFQMLSRGHFNWAFHLNDPDAKRTVMWVFGPWNQAKQDPIDDAAVELVCQATSASPTYFPPVEFTLTDTTKEPHRGKTFSLIDGSLAINNPVCNFSFTLAFFLFL